MIIDGFTPVAVEGNKVTFKHVRLPGELTMAADKLLSPSVSMPDWMPLRS
ncbi:hypothetical protein ACNKHT_14020 [Shigella flexneri]